MNPVIRTASLSKVYESGVSGRNSTCALDGIDVEVVPGEIFGLLGPNGAGKTTLLHLIMGFLFPSAGEVRVFGHLPGEPEPGPHAR